MNDDELVQKLYDDLVRITPLRRPSDHSKAAAVEVAVELLRAARNVLLLPAICRRVERDHEGG